MSEQLKSDESLKRKGHVSERGGFEVNANPAITPPNSAAFVAAAIKANPEAVVKGFSHEALAEKYGADEAAKKMGELLTATSPGSSTTLLLSQPGPNGMSLAHVWFGPNFSLFRHSHPAFGDCLYYVIGGEIKLGSRVLGKGSTVFIPNGQPYKYSAGPAGVELLEFRAGGGDKSAPGIKVEETTLSAIQKMIDIAHENDSLWKVPEHMGDTVIRQAEYDAEKG